MITEIDRFLIEESSKTDLVIEALVLVESDLLQALITVSVRL